MEENSHILHCYDNLVAMATANNCIFSLVVYSLLLKIYLRGYSVHTRKYKAQFFFVWLELARAVRKSAGFVFVVRIE